MSQTATKERSALDAFAATMPPPGEAAQQLPAVTTGTAINLVHGAQQVAVQRDERRVLERLRALAAAAGEAFYYRYPVRNKRKGTTDWIEGPSIKLANDLSRIYGNCEVDCRFVDEGTFWVFYARFVDLETGFALTRPFRARATTSKLGGDDDERRVDGSFQIGVSKAERNVVVNALQTFADFALAEAKRSLVAKIGSNLQGWRNDVAGRLNELHIDLRRVEATIGRPAKEWLAPDIARIIAMMKAVQDGMSTLNDTFPPLDAGEKDDSSALNEFAGGPSSAPADGGPAPEAPAETSAEADEREMVGSAPDPDASADLQLLRECIDKLLRVATDKKVDTDAKLEVLENAIPSWEDRLPRHVEFAATAANTAAKVAKGELKEAAARKYLEGLVRDAPPSA